VTKLARFARVKVFSEGSGRVKIINGIPVIVIKYNGEFKAYVAVCPHKGYVLCERTVREGKLFCPGHGEQFKIENGQPTIGKSKEPLPVLNTTVINGDVYIELPGDDIIEWIMNITRPSIREQ